MRTKSLGWAAPFRAARRNQGLMHEKSYLPYDWR